MADHRMFSSKIVRSTRFLKMPASSRLLYYDLGMSADDEGVVEAWRVMRETGATEDDLRVLVSKEFIQVLNDDLVALIMDWKINNIIRKDRQKDSIYKHLLVKIDEAVQTGILQENEQCDSDGCQLVDKWLPQDKIRQDKTSKDKTKAAYYADEPLNEAFSAFVEMRKKIKAPMTGRAVELAKKKLESLAVDPETKMFDAAVAVQILDQSISNCWKGLFPLHGEEKKPGKLDWIDNIDYGGDDGQLPFSDF